MMFKRIVARPEGSKLPSLPLPFHVRSAGLYRFDGEACLPLGHAPLGFVQVFWGAAGAGKLLFSAGPAVLKAGDVAWKLSAEPHGYESAKEPWELRWFTFDGLDADRFMESYGYPRFLEGAGPCPTALFDEIESKLSEMSPFGQRSLVATASSLLALAGRQLDAKPAANKIVDAFMELAQRRCQDASTNVNSLADELGAHRSTLTKHFKELTGASPGEYLDDLRIQRAITSLGDAAVSISEAGAKAGFLDKCHFSRFFKRKTGMAPSAYRAKL